MLQKLFAFRIGSRPGDQLADALRGFAGAGSSASSCSRWAIRR
jgi:hypothetical protein